jgi:hypothetical protein
MSIRIVGKRSQSVSSIFYWNFWVECFFLNFSYRWFFLRDYCVFVSLYFVCWKHYLFEFLTSEIWLSLVFLILVSWWLVLRWFCCDSKVRMLKSWLRIKVFLTFVSKEIPWLFIAFIFFSCPRNRNCFHGCWHEFILSL